MKKIIHMSDLHIGYEDNAARFARLIEKIKCRIADKAGDHIIVITGDLVDNAYDRSCYGDVKAGFHALREAGFQNILLVPGNHDYGTGDRGNKDFVKLFRHTFFDDERPFPRTDIIGEIALIGLDSMAEELHWYDEIWAEGELGDRQLDCLKRALRQEDVRACRRRVIYLHHHPFDFRPLHQLKDSWKLERVLKSAIKEEILIDALLYGHNHEGKVHNGRWGIPQCYDAGSATLKPRPRFVDWMPWFQTRASIRIIDLEMRSARILT